MAEVVADFMQQYVPDEWLYVADAARLLFTALARGDSCITLTAAQRALLENAPTLVGHAGDFAPFILCHHQLFPGRLWQLEQDIAENLLRLTAAPVPRMDLAAAAADLSAWFTGEHSRSQRLAAALALLRPLMLINGGPGTGKTTTVAGLLALICRHAWQQTSPPRIALVAPTGKAAAHMAEALHRALGQLNVHNDERCACLYAVQGQTIHRLLQFRPPLARSVFHRHRPLPVDIVVVDEASMLDLSLLRTLLLALPDQTRLILLGDHHQLPAVGTGNILADLAQQTELPPALAETLSILCPHHALSVSPHSAPLSANVVTLNYSHRFHEHSGIGRLAEAVLAGDGAMMASVIAAYPQELVCQNNTMADRFRLYYRLQADYWQAVAEHRVNGVFAALHRQFILSVRREEALAFNQGYRHWLGLRGHQTQGNWFAGMPLIITQNDYVTGLFNGDIGVVLADAAGRLHAYFEEGEQYRAVSLSRLPEHECAFVITVHKSQGSEYDEVWLLSPQKLRAAEAAEAYLFDRALLYTALTRAKKRFVFCGSLTQMQQAAARVNHRRSGLRAALRRAAVSSKAANAAAEHGCE